MKVSAATTFWLCYQMFFYQCVDGKLKVTVLSVNLIETATKFVNIVRFDVSPDSFLNCEAEILQNLTSLYVSLEALSNKSGILTSIVKTPNYNFCAALANVKKKEISIINMITQQLLQSVSVTNCPIPIGRVAFKNFRLDGSKIPLKVPSGLYYIYFNMLTMENGRKIIIARQGFDIRVERM